MTSSLEPGELRLRREDWLGDSCLSPSHLVIERADPVVWCAAEILAEIRAGQKYSDYPVVIDGDLLTFNAANRTVIYRLGEYDPEWNRYLMTWPD